MGEIVITFKDVVEVFVIDDTYVPAVMKILGALKKKNDSRTSYQLSDGQVLCGYCHHIWYPYYPDPIRCNHCGRLFRYDRIERGKGKVDLDG
jgi:hypothetical protein